MKLLVRLALLSVVVGLGPALPVEAQTAGADTADMIVLTSGDPASVAAGIRAMGGRVSLVYKNVPALAASIPRGQLAALGALAGVVGVQKDAMISLPPPFESSPGRRSKSGLREAPGQEPEHLSAPRAKEVDPAAEGVQIQALDVKSLSADRIRPNGYINYLETGAAQTWIETGFGTGSVVAVVDTGTHPVFPCLSSGQVIGAPGFPNGFDSIGDNPANAANNLAHGTWVGGVVSSACTLIFDSTSLGALGGAINNVAPELLFPVAPGFVGVDLLGMAPGAQVYPVKVFPRTSGSTPTSEVLEGLDHVLTLKKGGLLDVDIVNLSLGGATLFDGRDALDRFIGELRKENILVVAGAGNAGPIPNTVGSPATSFSSISAGATDQVVSSRLLYEYLGLVSGLGPGQSLVMRPTDETRIVNFSGRGPTSDGRAGPDIAALGTWNFVQNPAGTFSWVAGTSFSAPTIAGAAALLNAFWENSLGYETQPGKIRNALLLGADFWKPGRPWRHLEDEGLGVIDVPKALAKLKHHRYLPGIFFPIPARSGLPVILDHPGCERHVDEFRTRHPVKLDPAVVQDWVWEISDRTSRVKIELFDIKVPDNSATAFFANALQIDVQSAKRTDTARPLATVLCPDPTNPLCPARIDATTIAPVDIVIEDGLWTMNGVPVANQPMEPGHMKLALSGDFVNESPVSFKARITRENRGEKLTHPVSKGFIKQDDSFLVPVVVPAGTARATFDLTWFRDWSSFPTSDLDMTIVPPSGPANQEGVTLNAPERAVLNAPAPGIYFVVVAGAEVHKPDFYRLFVTLE